ncbi:MAG: hypothetical protein ACPL6F_00700 [Anaerolineales bacterium]
MMMPSSAYFHTPSRLERIFQTLKSELGNDLLGTFLLNGEDNRIVFAILEPGQRDYPSFYTTLMKISTLIGEKMRLGKVEDNLIITDRYYLLTRSLGQNTYYWGILVQKQAPLGSVRILMDRYAPQILQAIV